MKRFVFLLLSGLILSACEMSSNGASVQFHAVDVSRTNHDLEFSLTDHTGQARRLSDWRGKVVLVFFGFTQCPDVCPTALLRAKETMALLGGEADKVQVVFITLDPERDTPALLANYVPYFDSRFLGLTGSLEQIAQVAKNFKVEYRKVPGSQPGSYTLDHSALTYVFDPTGRLRLAIKHAATAQEMADDIQKLLAGH